MTHKPPSLLGGSLLITGSCVGAGMLGLPVLSGLAGFLPALMMFFIVWIFMTMTGLLLVEAGGWFPKQVNFLSIVEHSLGRFGKVFCWGTYLFLFYALLVAYISASGSLFSSFFEGIFRLSLPTWIGSLFFVFVFGYVVYRGTRQVDLWNRLLMIGKIIFFLILMGIGVSHIKIDLLARSKLSFAIFSLPILVTSFGFHNVVPSLIGYYKGDQKKVKQAILLGSSMAFGIYILWEVLVLGIVPLEGKNGLFACLQKDFQGAQAISGVLQNISIQVFAEGMAFFAILTSFLVQALTVVHFLADGFSISYKKQESPWLCALALLPPLALSIVYPGLFFAALNFAGGLCATLLFGVLPVLIIWIGRYKKSGSSSYRVFGGKTVLLAIFSFSIFIFAFELLRLFGWIKIPGIS